MHVNNVIITLYYKSVIRPVMEYACSVCSGKIKPERHSTPLVSIPDRSG